MHWHSPHRYEYIMTLSALRAGFLRENMTFCPIVYIMLLCNKQYAMNYQQQWQQKGKTNVTYEWNCNNFN